MRGWWSGLAMSEEIGGRGKGCVYVYDDDDDDVYDSLLSIDRYPCFNYHFLFSLEMHWLRVFVAVNVVGLRVVKRNLICKTEKIKCRLMKTAAHAFARYIWPVDGIFDASTVIVSTYPYQQRRV
jgi:hypothetical protein